MCAPISSRLTNRKCRPMQSRWRSNMLVLVSMLGISVLRDRREVVDHPVIAEDERPIPAARQRRRKPVVVRAGDGRGERRLDVPAPARAMSRVYTMCLQGSARGEPAVRAAAAPRRRAGGSCRPRAGERGECGAASCASRAQSDLYAFGAPEQVERLAPSSIAARIVSAISTRPTLWRAYWSSKPCW